MRPTKILCWILLAVVLQAIAKENEVRMQLQEGNYRWLASLRGEHPRIFLNKDTLPVIKQRALQQVPQYWQELLNRVEKYPLHPKLNWDEKKLRRDEDGKLRFVPPHFMLASRVLDIVGGIEAQETALAYLLTGEKQYLEKARNLLLFSVETYDWALENQLLLEWEVRHYPGTCMAYDWLYQDLTPAERERVIRPLLENIRQLQPGGKATFHRCHGSKSDGFYGVRSLPWYAGLATYGDGIDDPAALEMLQTGFDRNLQMLEHREKVGAGDGVLVSACLGYAMGAYPYTTFNFFFSFASATGLSVAPQFPQMRDYPVFTFWNMIPAKPTPLEFGFGDSRHLRNAFPVGNIFSVMQQIRHFYGGTDPATERLACQLIEQVPEPSRRYSTAMNRVLPFLLTNLTREEPASEQPFAAGRFRYFPSIGIAYMRSDDSPDATFAAFRAGSRTGSHQHYDESHFVIYRQGFLALDSGTRGGTWSYHLPWYYAQSVAHNTMLIHMPDEKIAQYWGPETRISWDEEVPKMHGGQYRQLQAQARAADNEYFAYVNNDATDCYRSEKCRLARREFIFLYPDLFLIIDQVASTKAEYRKEWLLHCQEEPELLPEQAFRLAQGNGLLLGQTLFPKVDTAKVGGPEKQFWASGRNWESHPVHDRQYQSGLIGHWRLEVSPQKAAEEDLLVNMLQTAERNDNPKLPKVDCREIEGKLHLNFAYNNLQWEFAIPRQQTEKTTLRLRKQQQLLYDQEL